MRILTLVDTYLPGFRGGGPVRSVSNLVSLMPSGNDFCVVTRDRDHGASEPYEGVVPGEWTSVGRAQVLYLARRSESAATLARVAMEMRPDLVYANSLWSSMTIRYMFARFVPGLRDIPFLIAPRGELSAGAMSVKPLKKEAFLRTARVAGLIRGADWQASTDLERAEISAAVGRRAAVHVASDIAAPAEVSRVNSRGDQTKEEGRVRFVFISRISPKKNLLEAIRMLATARGEVSLDVYGPLEDRGYWERCVAVARELPASVTVRHVGEVAPEDVPATFSKYDFFLFPTLGENFGHVIIEALTAGCPVVLSDTTPWVEVGQLGCGWTIRLQDRERWREVLQRCVDMSESDHRAMRSAARSAVPVLSKSGEALDAHIRMFSAVVQGRPPRGSAESAH